MRTRFMWLLMVAAILAGCNQTASLGGEYELDEFYITGPRSLSGDTGSVVVHNDGEFPHTLVVTNEAGHVITATALVQPGDTVTLDLDLDDGAYMFTCRIVAENEGQLFDHFELGMHQLVEVSG